MLQFSLGEQEREAQSCLWERSCGIMEFCFSPEVFNSNNRQDFTINRIMQPLGTCCTHCALF